MNADRLAAEGSVHQLEHAALLRDFVEKDVVFGGWLGSEEVSKRFVGQQATPIGGVDLRGDRGGGQEPLEQADLIWNRLQPLRQLEQKPPGILEENRAPPPGGSAAPLNIYRLFGQESSHC